MSENRSNGKRRPLPPGPRPPGRGRGLLERVLAARDAERRRVARELHDGCGQELTAALLLVRRLDEAKSLGAARPVIRSLRRRLSGVIAELDRQVRDLHPAALDDLGLVGALRRTAAETARLHDVAIEVEASQFATRALPPAVQTAIYRIGQEALANAVRHARPRRVRLRLVSRDGSVTLTVDDDGRGLPSRRGTASPRPGLGLRSMRERAALLGGEVTVASRRGRGTTLTARLPVGEPALPSRQPGARRAGR